MLWAVLLSLLQPVPVEVRPYLAPDAAFDEEQGLVVEKDVLADGVIEYERPVVLLPPALTQGELHTSQRRFVIRDREGGEKRDVGAHYFEAELMRVESLESFGECLVVRRRQVRMDFSGSKETVDVTEWYAPGRGVVKALGERVLTSDDGAVLRRETIATEP